MASPEELARCKSCGEQYKYEELEPEDSPVATCPNCGGHRFESVVG